MAMSLLFFFDNSTTRGSLDPSMTTPPVTSPTLPIPVDPVRTSVTLSRQLHRFAQLGIVRFDVFGIPTIPATFRQMELQRLHGG